MVGVQWPVKMKTKPAPWVSIYIHMMITQQVLHTSNIYITGVDNDIFPHCLFIPLTRGIEQIARAKLEGL